MDGNGDLSKIEMTFTTTTDEPNMIGGQHYQLGMTSREMMGASRISNESGGGINTTL
jgi:hypothetical protein